jgi:rubrerythrin
VAREEGLEEVAVWFDTLSVAEGMHLRRFQHLLEDMPNM